MTASHLHAYPVTGLVPVTHDFFRKDVDALNKPGQGD